MKINKKGLKVFEDMAKKVQELEMRVDELEKKVAAGTTTKEIANSIHESFMNRTI